MSTDVQLAHACPHQTFEEPILLSDDRQSLKTSQPCVLGGAVRVWVNGEHLVPPSGLHSFATLHGDASGPFSITAGNTDLVIRTSTATVSITLPTGVRVTTDRVVTAITAATIPTVLKVTNDRGYLVLKDTARVGMESRVRVTGLAAALVGFGNQYAARGRRVFPSWSLQEDTVQGYSVTRYPKFTAPVRVGTRFTVSYTAPRELCKRCQGSFIENDYRFEIDGAMAMVVNENLLQQVALKILLTALGSNPYYNWYGSTITTRIGGKVVGQVAAMLREDVHNCLRTAQRLQAAQSKYQTVSAKERLYAIRNVAVYPHKDDPTTFLIEADVQNASSESVNLSVVFTTPGTQATVRQVSRFLPSS